jgi:hypothetical protein
VFVVFTALAGPTQPITLVVDALGIEPFNARGPVGGVAPVKPGFSLYAVGCVTPRKLVIARGAVGADFGTGRLVVGLVGEWGREAIESVAEEGGGAAEVEGGGAVVVEDDELGVGGTGEAGGSEGCFGANSLPFFGPGERLRGIMRPGTIIFELIGGRSAAGGDTARCSTTACLTLVLSIAAQ